MSNMAGWRCSRQPNNTARGADFFGHTKSSRADRDGVLPRWLEVAASPDSSKKRLVDPIRDRRYSSIRGCEGNPG